MNLWYFGSDALSLRLLRILVENRGKLGLHSITVVVPPERTLAVKNPLKLGAKELELRVLEAPFTAPRPRDEEWNAELRSGKKDFGVVFSFGYFVPRSVVETFSLCVNLHPSLLPEYRGAAPIQHAILNGERQSGVSIIELHASKFDCGDILRQEALELSPNHTFSTISASLVDLGGELIMKVLSEFPEMPFRRPQQGIDTTTLKRAPKIDKNVLSTVSFENQPAGEIWNIYRAMERLKCTLNSQTKAKLSLFNLSPPTRLDFAQTCRSGDVFYDASREVVFIRCGEIWFPCKTLQVEDRKLLSAKEFYHGHLAKRKTAALPEVYERVLI